MDATKAARLTITMTGRMVFLCRPAGLAWWQYLDHAWETSVAEQVLDLWCPEPLPSAAATTPLLVRRRWATRRRGR
jgi:hypothetical protein